MSYAEKALALDETLVRVAEALEGGSTPIQTRLTNLGASIAPQFDATETYAVGAYVMYEDKMYKCTTTHTGAWDASDFDDTDVVSEMGSGGGLNVAPGAGPHNAIYRGQSLGTSVSADQYAEIQAGTFNDMFIGDYWTIGGIVYRIAAFDYWYNCGDTACTTHHVVLVPDTCIGENQKMNDSHTTEGGYVGSKMYTTYLDSAKGTITTAFGSAHILNHRELLVNAVSNGKPSSGSWYDSTIELMNEEMVYGSAIFEGANDGTTIPYKYTIDKSQLPLFVYRHDLIGNRAYWWLRSVVSATNFADVGDTGYARYNGAGDAYGVRPAFAIC